MNNILAHSKLKVASYIVHGIKCYMVAIYHFQLHKHRASIIYTVLLGLIKSERPGGVSQSEYLGVSENETELCHFFGV